MKYRLYTGELRPLAAEPPPSLPDPTIEEEEEEGGSSAAPASPWPAPPPPAPRLMDAMSGESVRARLLPPLLLLAADEKDRRLCGMLLPCCRSEGSRSDRPRGTDPRLSLP